MARIMDQLADRVVADKASEQRASPGKARRTSTKSRSRRRNFDWHTTSTMQTDASRFLRSAREMTFTHCCIHVIAESKPLSGGGRGAPDSPE